MGRGMKYRGWCIVSDYDGTLTNENFSFESKNREVAKYFIKNKGKFGIATGRGMMEINRETNGSLPYNLPSIFYNGALIIDPEENNIFWSCPIPKSYKSLLNNFMTVFPDLMVHLGLMNKLAILNKGIISNQLIQDVCAYMHLQYDQDGVHREIKEMFLKEREWDVPMKLEDVDESVFKIMIHGEVDRISKARYWFEKETHEKGYLISSSNSFNLEIVNKLAGKRNAIKQIRNLINGCKTVVIGDGENDIEMFDCANFSIAPHHSHNRAKSTATYVLEPNAVVMNEALKLIDKENRICKI